MIWTCSSSVTSAVPPICGPVTSLTRPPGKLAASARLCDSPGVRIDGEKVGSPYVIEAIGESHNLAEAANFPGGLVSEVTGPQVGGTAEVTELPQVQITALHAPEEHRYARPAPSPTK